MQAIKTKYYPSFTGKPAKVKASCVSGSITVIVDTGVDYFQWHRAACNALLDKLNWASQLIKPYGGQLPDGSYVWTFPYPESEA